MIKNQVLIVEDEVNLRKVLRAMLIREGYSVFESTNGEEALSILNSDEIHTVITDLKMPIMDGMQLFNKILRDRREIPVIFITAYGTIDSAVEAIKKGAFDFITKPFDQEELKNVIRKAISTYNLNQKSHITKEIEKQHTQIIGNSAEIQNIFSIIRKVANTPSTVLIYGESGTGKELVARTIHEESNRNSNPFIPINCAAIPRELMESELFGYEKGAFTGAVTTKPGKMELAHGGTLFLDEVAEIPIEMQVKLLRAIQENSFERVGGLKTIHVDVRIISATNRDLSQMVKSQSFREDLYYRLNVVPIKIPPLRERKTDIPLLVGHILKKFNIKLQKNIKGIEDSALKTFMLYHWPGNIRELENLLERLMLFCDGDEIKMDDIPEDFLLREDMVIEPLSSLGVFSLKEAVKEKTASIEKKYILSALKETRGNISKAARLLMISRKSLQNKIKEFDLRGYIERM